MTHPSDASSLPPGTDIKASPRMKDILKSSGFGTGDRLREVFKIDICTKCGEEVVILGGSDPICAQCFLGVEHITRESMELITNLDFDVSEEEFRQGLHFFVEAEDGFHYTREEFFKMNARLILNDMPLNVPEEFKEEMDRAVRDLIKSDMIGQLPPGPVADFLAEALDAGKVQVDPKTKTIVVGVGVGEDGTISSIDTEALKKEGTMLGSMSLGGRSDLDAESFIKKFLSEFNNEDNKE